MTLVLTSKGQYTFTIHLTTDLSPGWEFYSIFSHEAFVILGKLNVGPTFMTTIKTLIGQTTGITKGIFQVYK